MGPRAPGFWLDLATGSTGLRWERGEERGEGSSHWLRPTPPAALVLAVPSAMIAPAVAPPRALLVPGGLTPGWVP